MIHYGHLIALEGAPILSADGFTILARFAHDVRLRKFVNSLTWMPAQASAPLKEERYTAWKVFALGPVQVWQLSGIVAANDLGRVFADPMFRLEPPHPKLATQGENK